MTTETTNDLNIMNKYSIPIPWKEEFIPQNGGGERLKAEYWEGTSGVTCVCGGSIEWAEAGYVPGARACRSCLRLYMVRGDGLDRHLAAQAYDHDENHGRDATDDDTADKLSVVPEDLYPGWYQRRD